MVHVVAYQPKPGIPLEDYPDFQIGMKFNEEELIAMAKQGVMPPGLVLQIPGGWPCVVRGPYGTKQTVERLTVL